MWYLKEYNPIQAGSIDGTDTEPHDLAIDRASQSQYRPPHRLETDPNCTLFVGRLSFDTEEPALKKHFEKYGDITNISIIRNQVTALSQGYGFLTFACEKDAKCAYKDANKSTLDGHTILVDFERSRVMKNWIPRRMGGGFGGKKESGQLRFGARDRPFKKPASSHVQVPYEQKFSDNWTNHQPEERSKRSRSPSSSHHTQPTSSKRRRSRSRSRSPTSSHSRYHSNRSASDDRRRHSIRSTSIERRRHGNHSPSTDRRRHDYKSSSSRIYSSDNRDRYRHDRYREKSPNRR